MLRVNFSKTGDRGQGQYHSEPKTVHDTPRPQDVSTQQHSGFLLKPECQESDVSPALRANNLIFVCLMVSWCLTVSLSLSHWYPGSGVVLDYIDS